MNDVIIAIAPIAAAIISVGQVAVSVGVSQVNGPSISITQDTVLVAVEQVNAPIITVSSSGVQGIQGEAGTPGAIGGVYLHTQGVALATWEINHNLGYYPNVSVVDSADRLVFTSIEYLNQNTLRVLASGAFSGKAFLS